LSIEKKRHAIAHRFAKKVILNPHDISHREEAMESVAYSCLARTEVQEARSLSWGRAKAL